ncbi:hypothetical protein CERZMDRAFT_46749 [Cercospora zeae-maydis SCOH1-5]|uniref:FAD-binding domain-containing protein n=1 Tax=Cercospora zeae-maydis SCOH1-5 TaxID=717836 RepID=A0A6A6F838_9PEZI|nr:hypothetical protein CERZMDRAFT_46749 [Cercospora zeae-maydis SCOH1-5]
MPLFEEKLGNGNDTFDQSKTTQDEVKCAPPTGIDVLVVGAGVGGLATALECVRKGHSVRVVERSEAASAGGDMFTIGANALRLLDNYPAMKREYDEIAIHNLWLRYRKWTGEDLGDPFPFGGGAKGAEENKHAKKPPMSTVLRPLFHKMLYHQLERFGVQVRFGVNVREFYEDGDRKVGGVVTESGEKIEADLIIAADGLHSKSHSIVSKNAPAAKPTGRTIFRSAFSLDIAEADPLVAETFGRLNGQDPLMQVWLVTFREEESENRKETWNDTVSSEEVLAVMDRLPGWSEAMKQLLRVTPPEHIVAWPLNPRNPSAQWSSPGARVLQVGDSAHSFLPTSGNGATQAIEDAITIATCLSHAGRNDLETAVKVHNLLRADRVSCAQLLGYVNAARVQKTDFEKVGKDPSKVQHKTPKWLWALDPERYAEENYAKAKGSLEVGGQEFRNTNIPEGFMVKPWTIEEVEALQRAGKEIELEGDWS